MAKLQRQNEALEVLLAAADPELVILNSLSGEGLAPAAEGRGRGRSAFSCEKYALLVSVGYGLLLLHSEVRGGSSPVRGATGYRLNDTRRR